MATVKKPIKKACSGTSLYPKKSSVSSKLKAGGKIKKAQNSVPSDTLSSKKLYENSPFQMARQQMAKANNNKEIIKKFTDKANQELIDKFSKKKNGGSVKAKDGKWIQKAVNPKHKGYCTPMTKATCTPKRKALAKTFKKMARERKGK
jgi:hypothetical protein